MPMLDAEYPDRHDDRILLDDLRWVKIPPDDRDTVNRLRAAFKERSLKLAESSWLRTMCRRYKVKIEEYRQSQHDVAMTDRRFRVGTPRFRELQKRAQSGEALKERLAEREAEVKVAQDAKEDFGF